METVDNVIKQIPKKMKDHVKKTKGHIVIIISPQIYDAKKVKKGMYKGFKVEMSDEIEKGSIYITTRQPSK